MIQTNICEHYSPSFSPDQEHLRRYNRSTVIEIRSEFCIPNEVRNMLNTMKPYYVGIEMYTEDKKLIQELDEISIREFSFGDEAAPVQMLVFCPMMYMSDLFMKCDWITDTIILSIQSWYTSGLTREAQHKIFCKEKCYHIDLDRRMAELRRHRKEEYLKKQQDAIDEWHAKQKEAKHKDSVHPQKIPQSGQTCPETIRTGHAPIIQLKSTIEFPSLTSDAKTNY